EEDGLVLSDVLKIEVPIRIEGDHMQGLPRIRFAYGVYVLLWKVPCQSDIEIDGLGVGSGLPFPGGLVMGLVGGHPVLRFGFTGQEKEQGCKGDKISQNQKRLNIK